MVNKTWQICCSDTFDTLRDVVGRASAPRHENLVRSSGHVMPKMLKDDTFYPVLCLVLRGLNEDRLCLSGISMLICGISVSQWHKPSLVHIMLLPLIMLKIQVEFLSDLLKISCSV